MSDDHLGINHQPLIVDIKRHSLEDGPGIRSVVFFKGCPLHCVFCHNPENQEPGMEIAFSAKDCIHCGRCVDICPQEAIDLELPDRIYRDKCSCCGKCASECPGNGLRCIGNSFSVEALEEILLRDLPFYRHSGGGVTLSGGECTSYPEYLELLLKQLKAKEIHIALETSGYFDYDVFKQRILPYIDSVYYSIKIADPEVHRRYTGKTNRRIISNLQRLFWEGEVEVHPVVPLIPGITATQENLLAITDILCEAGAEEVCLLPYNPMGIEMAVSLGRHRPSLPERFMKHNEEIKIQTMFRRILEKKKAKLAV